MNTETTEKKSIGKAQSVVKDLEELNNGSWRLEYKLTNPRGKEGFAGIMLENYVDPVAKSMRKFVDQNNRVAPGIWIGEIVKVYTPSIYPAHQRELDFIIGHPNVKVNHKEINTNAEYLKHKIDNPRFVLTNLDYEDISNIEEEDYIDVLKGRLSRETGKSAIGLDKLRYILAELNMSYRDAKYINDKQREKKKLRNILKKHASKGMKQAKDINKVINDLDNAKETFILKELLEHKIITQNKGAYLYNGNMLSTTFSGLREYMRNNIEFYEKLQQALFTVFEDKNLE